MWILVRLSVAAALAVSAGFAWTVGQSGLQQANRNLCDLWASLPLPPYKSCEFQNALVYSWLAVAIIAVVWLLVEFFRITIVRRFISAATKGLWLKLEPYLVIIGLVAIVGGALLVGYVALKQSGDLAALKKQLASLAIPPSSGSSPRASMLTGRTVSGLEVVQRLEQLETELASTKQELTDTQQRLADAQTPKSPTTRLGGLTATQIPAAVSPSPPSAARYTPYEKEQRLRAVDEIYTVIATQLQPTYDEGRALIYEIYQKEAVDVRAEQRLSDYLDKVRAGFDNLKTLQKKYSYFADIVQTATTNKFSVVVATHEAGNLIPELAALRSKAPNDMHWFLLRDTTMLGAVSQIRDFEQYLTDTTAALQQKRAEIEKREVSSGQ